MICPLCERDPVPFAPALPKPSVFRTLAARRAVIRALRLPAGFPVPLLFGRRAEHGTPCPVHTLSGDPSMSRITLGDRVKCRITGIVGIAVCRSQWLTGCARITVQGPTVDGKPADLQTIDEPMLDVVEAGVVKPLIQAGVDDEPGGPRPEPVRHPTPTR